MDLGPELVQRVGAAGWTPERHVAVAPNVPESHPAHAVLASLGGLAVGEEADGTDIVFRYRSAGIVAAGWSQRLDTTLVAIGEYHHGYGTLYLDLRGRCFTDNDIDDGFCFVGDTFAEAVECVLLGRRARPLLRADQDRVVCYGVEYRRGDPQIYSYE